MLKETTTEFLKLYQKKQEKDIESKQWELYVSVYPHMSKKIDFDEFRGKKNIKTETKVNKKNKKTETISKETGNKLTHGLDLKAIFEDARLILGAKRTKMDATSKKKTKLPKLNNKLTKLKNLTK